MSTSGQLDLYGKLLQIQVVFHVRVDGLADENSCLGTVFLGPLGVKLLLCLVSTFLRDYISRIPLRPPHLIIHAHTMHHVVDRQE